jgi:hypothetical protein
MCSGLMVQNATPCHTGDYGGDKGVVFYDPDIVQNADIKYSYEPEGLLADNFSRSAGAGSAAAP